MAKVSELLNSLDPATKLYDYFLQDLLTSSCDIPYDTEEANSIENIIITAINTKCNKALTRNGGLKFLFQILPRISKETLIKYNAFWITKAIQILESAQSNISELQSACLVLASLVVSCKEIPELHKQISMQTVKQLIYLISNMKSERRCGATYYLISVLLQHYPEVCERSHESIKKLIIPLIDSSQQNLVTAGANCYTLLTKATERSFKPPVKFSNYTNGVYNQLLLCNSLHDIMNKLFTDILEFDSSDKRDLEISDTLNLPEISEDIVLKYYIDLERRFAHLCVYLSTMLRGCGDKNFVSPTDIFQLLCRGLAVTPFNLGHEDSIKKQILFSIIPKLHISLLKVLSALIEGFHVKLMPFFDVILKLIQQTLDWTERVSQDQSTLSLCKPFKNVRISAYKTLTIWLQHTKTSSGVENVTEYLLPHILKEIKVMKNAIFLTVQKTNHLSKKSHKKFRDSQYENSPILGNSTGETRDVHLNVDLCEQALVALESILFSCPVGLKDPLYKQVQNEVVDTLNDLYLGASETNVYKVNAGCRLQLLKTLKALLMNPNLLTPPPTQSSIEIFDMALRDQDINVVKEATSNLAELEKIIHPSAPTLNFPIQRRDESEDDKDKEPNELASIPGISQQRSMNELLDSIRTNECSKENRKRASEDEKITTRKLPRNELIVNEPILPKIANLDVEESSKKSENTEIEIVKASSKEDGTKMGEALQDQDLDCELVNLFVDELHEEN